MSPAARIRLASIAAMLAMLLCWLVLRTGETGYSGRNPPLTTRSAESGAESGAAPTVGSLHQAPPEKFHRETPTRPGMNAADVYKDAFALFAKLSDEQKRMLKEPTKDVDADKAAELYRQLQPIMDLLRRAATMETCDWGLGDVDFTQPLTHMTCAIELGRAALWNAAYRFDAEPAAALDDLSARARMGHHCSDFIIGALVAASLEAGAIDLLRDRAPAMTGEIAGKAADFIAASAIDRGFARGFESEIAGMQHTMKMLGEKSPADRRAMIAGFQLTGDEPDEQKNAKLDAFDKLLSDPEARAAEVAFMTRVEREMAESLDWPEERFAAWWRQTLTEAREKHAYAEFTLPTISQVRNLAQARKVERGLLAAGLDVLQNGPARAGSHIDPVTGAAFAYVPGAEGFVLQSTFIRNGKPVKMNFRKAP